MGMSGDPTNRAIIQQAQSIESSPGGTKGNAFEIKYEGEEGAIIAINHKSDTAQAATALFRQGVTDSMDKDYVAPYVPDIIFLPYSEDKPHDYYEAGSDIDEGMIDQSGKEFGYYFRDETFDDVRRLLESATQDNTEMTKFLYDHGVGIECLPPAALGQREFIDYIKEEDGNSLSLALLACHAPRGSLSEDEFISVLTQPYALDFLHSGNPKGEVFEFENLRKAALDGEYGEMVKKAFWAADMRNRHPKEEEPETPSAPS